MIDPKKISQIRELEKSRVEPINLYRFQLNHEFPLSEAEKLLNYLQKLGIDTLYLSPIFEPKKKSLHGYDVVNPLKVNPEIGGKQALKSFSAKAKSLDMSIVIDLVANHMSTCFSNPWWFDILECGCKSLYGSYFDIDWKSSQVKLKGKVLLPLLEEPFYDALSSAKIQLVANEKGLFFSYLKNLLPLNPLTYFDTLSIIVDKHLKELLKEFKALEKIEDIEDSHSQLKALKARWKNLYLEGKIKKEILQRCKEINQNVDKGAFLDTCLSKQNFLLEFWQDAPREINYRRFFDINDLAALRMENSIAFDHYHELTFELLKEGVIQGLRIDHPDGFYEPYNYFADLQRKYLGCRGVDTSQVTQNELKEHKPLYLILEKILEEDEYLPDKWQTMGTVGYEYLNLITHLYIDSDSEDLYEKLYDSFHDHKVSYIDLLQEEKRSFTTIYMQSEVQSLCEKLEEIFKEKKVPFKSEDIKSALIELFSSFPVYRTYLEQNSSEISKEDKAALIRAFERALEVNPSYKTVIEELRHVFFNSSKRSFLEDQFVMRFQQICPTIMAKGFEDTHLYNYNRFLACNEVGGFGKNFGVSVEEFHRKMQIKLEKSPYSWITSSTHDTKRSEGVRLRLTVLSEMYEDFSKLCLSWKKRLSKHKVNIGKISFPDSKMEYFIYQTLVGFWPEFELSDEKKLEYATRVKSYVVKACKEAKMFTNWVNCNVAYEKSMESFIDNLLFRDSSFYSELKSFVKKISVYGVQNVLSATALKIGLPAALDIYQGTEFIDFALVDPDNRRSVDYKKRMQTLNHYSKDFTNNYDGEKLFIMNKGFHFRREFSELIFLGDYIPLKVSGDKNSCLIAYARVNSDKVLIVMAARFSTKFTKKNMGDTYIKLPDKLAKRQYSCLFSNEQFEVGNRLEITPFCLEKRYCLIYS